MGKDQLDVMLEDYFSEIENGADINALRDSAVALYKEGLSKEGVLRLIEGELGKDKRDVVAGILSDHKEPEPEAVSGIGGWLAFFCLVLIVFSPARSIVSLLKTLDSIEEITMQYVVIAVVLGMVAFSVMSGVALLMRKSYAVRLAKIYLLTVLVVNVVIPMLLVVLDFSKAYTDAILGDPFRTLFSPVLFFLIWFGYLNSSTRVKNTYNNIS